MYCVYIFVCLSVCVFFCFFVRNNQATVESFLVFSSGFGVWFARGCFRQNRGDTKRRLPSEAVYVYDTTFVLPPGSFLFLVIRRFYWFCFDGMGGGGGAIRFPAPFFVMLLFYDHRTSLRLRLIRRWF